MSDKSSNDAGWGGILLVAFVVFVGWLMYRNQAKMTPEQRIQYYEQKDLEEAGMPSSSRW